MSNECALADGESCVTRVIALKRRDVEVDA
jgi:hypothetical protein